MTWENQAWRREMSASHEELKFSHSELKAYLNNGTEKVDINLADFSESLGEELHQPLSCLNKQDYNPLEFEKTTRDKIRAWCKELGHWQYVAADQVSCTNQLFLFAELNTKIEESLSREVSKAMEALNASFMEQLKCSHCELREGFQRKGEELDTKLNAFLKSLATESMECNTRLDEHQVWNVELESAFGRIHTIVKTLETSVEKLSETCASQLGSLLEEERQVRQEVRQAEAVSRTRELQEIGRAMKEVTQLTNQMNEERS